MGSAETGFADGTSPSSYIRNDLPSLFETEWALDLNMQPLCLATELLIAKTVILQLVFGNLAWQ